MDKSVPKNALLQINQGTVGQLGAYQLGLVSTHGDAPSLTAELVVSPRQAVKRHRNDLETKVSVQPGDLLPVGDRLYRIEQVVATESSSGSAGRPPPPGSRVVVIDSTPVQLPGVTLHPRAMLIQLGNTGELHGTEIAVDRIERHGQTGPIAHLSLWPNDYDKPYASAHGTLGQLAAAVGGYVRLGDAEHEVLAIVEPQPARHLRGWMELSAEPRRGDSREALRINS